MRAPPGMSRPLGGPTLLWKTISIQILAPTPARPPAPARPRTPARGRPLDQMGDRSPCGWLRRRLQLSIETKPPARRGRPPTQEQTGPGGQPSGPTDMEHGMSTYLVNGLAAASLGIVALFPTPHDFWSSVLPDQNAQAVAIQRVEDRKLDLELLNFSAPQLEAVVIPRITGCDQPLTELDAAMIASCQSALASAVHSLPGDAPIVDPTIEKARLALTKLCQAEWSAQAQHPSAALPMACQSVF